MIKDIEVFDIAHNAKQQREVLPQINSDVMRHLFIKHYLFCFIKQVTVIRYTNREQRADRDRVLIAKICELFDELFFGYAWLTDAAFEYSAERRFVVEIPHKEYKVYTAASAAEVKNATAGQILPRLLVYKQNVCGDIFKFYHFEKMPPDLINSAVKVGNFNLGFIDLMLKKKNYAAEFNEKTESELRRRLDLIDTDDAQLFAPVGDIDKVFLALNTLYANASTSTSNQPAQTEPAAEPASETTATAGGWGNLGTVSNKPADEPQTATAGGWGNLGTVSGDEANEKASSSDENNEAQTDDQQPAEIIEDMMKNADYNEILPAIAINTDTSTAQFIDALSIHEFRRAKAVKAVIQYILNVAAPDCLRKLERGEIKSPLDYYIEPHPREILRMMNEPVSTRAARDIEAAIIELHEKPLKYTRFVKDTVTVDSFQVITHIRSVNGKIIRYQFAPSIVTAGHVVNKAFKRFSSVKTQFATGKYVLSADVSDVDIIVSHILNYVNAGDTVYWQRIFEDFTFADTNTSRVQRRILDSFDRRGFDTRKVNKLGFVYAPKQGTAAANAAETAELAKATAAELAKIKKRTTNRKQKTTAKTAAKKTASRTASRTKKQ